MKRVLFALLSLALLGTAGCGLLPLRSQEALKRFTPTIKFQKLSIRKLSFEQAEVDFVFAVTNPNPLKVSLASFDYALAFEGAQVLAGNDPDGLTLQAQGSSEIVLPVTLVYREVYQTVQATKGKDEVAFSLKGSFGFKTPIGPIKVPYEDSGNFPAPRPPKIELQRLKLVERPTLLSPSAKAEVLIEVENEGASSLSFQNVQYNVKLSDRQAASGRVDSLAPVGAASTQTVALPITINLASLGASLISSIVSRQGQDLTLSLSTEVETPFGRLPLTLERRKSLALE